MPGSLQDLFPFGNIHKNHVQMESEDKWQLYADLRLNSMGIVTLVNFMEVSQFCYFLKSA